MTDSKTNQRETERPVAHDSTVMITRDSTVMMPVGAFFEMDDWRYAESEGDEPAETQPRPVAPPVVDPSPSEFSDDDTPVMDSDILSDHRMPAPTPQPHPMALATPLPGPDALRAIDEDPRHASEAFEALVAATPPRGRAKPGRVSAASTLKPVHFTAQAQLDLRAQRPVARVLRACDQEDALTRQSTQVRLARHRFAQACRTAGDWSLLFGDDGQRFSILLESDVFSDGRAADNVLKIIRQVELPHERIELRIPARAFAEHPGRITNALTRLRKLGVRATAVGMRELAMRGIAIRELPVDAVMVSWSNLSAALGDLRDVSERAMTDRLAWLQRFVQLTSSLGLRVVVEGVDSPVHLEMLRQGGIHEACGAAVGHAVSTSQELTGLLG